MTLGQIIRAYREENSMSMDRRTACSVYDLYKESGKRNVYEF